MPDWNVQRLRKPQMKTAAAALAKAFRDDPLARYMQPDESKVDSFNRWFFEKTLTYGLKWGETWTDTDARSAAAWLPPGQTDMTWWRTMRAGFTWLPFRVGFSGMARFNKLDSVLGRMRKASVEGPFWYLMVLGVAPEKQGTGLGSALIQAGTSRADDDRVPSYLETESLENVQFYQRRGFDVSAEAEIAPGFKMWSMRREPR